MRSLLFVPLLLPILSSCDRGGPVTPVERSNLDTTSHNYVWTVETLGDGNSSVLRDVAIINDTLAFAVGAIFKKDGENSYDPLPQNLVEWTSGRWDLRRVSVSFRGSVVTLPLEGIAAHSLADIWIVGSIPIHGDGTGWIGVDIRAMLGEYASVSRVWGSADEMYFVGRAGTVIRCVGSSWYTLPSGTTLPIQDIWGATNPTTGTAEVLCVASNGFSFPQDRRVLRLEGNLATACQDSGLPYNVRGIWHDGKSSYFIVGSGIYRTSSLTSSTVWQGKPLEITPYFMNAVRGTAANNVFVVGDFGEVLHFNGSTWRSFRAQTGLEYGSYWSVAVTERLVIAVGDNFDKAVVAVGRRVN